MCFGDVVVCLCMSIAFKVGTDCLSGVLSCEVSLKSKSLVGLPVVVLSSVWLSVCTTCFIISSMISP